MPASNPKKKKIPNTSATISTPPHSAFPLVAAAESPQRVAQRFPKH